MIKSKIYYLLLGIGLGIIITSSMNIAFNKAEKVEYSDEEIKEKAKSLGMISIKENIENHSKDKSEQGKEKVQEKKPTPEQSPQDFQVNDRSITIKPGDTASYIISNLKTAGIIEDEERFKETVIKHKLQTKFVSGTHTLKANSSDEEVLKKLIKENDLKNAGL